MTEIERKIKKLFIALTTFALAIVILWPIIYPKEDTCFNGQLDPGEYEIDCEGICEKTCPLPEKPPSVEDVKIAWAYAVKDGTDNYNLLAKVTNTNRNWGAQSVKYKFLVYGENNEVMETITGNTYIIPQGYAEGEGKKYVLYENYKTSQKISKVDFELSNFRWEEVRDMGDMRQFGVDTIKIKNIDYGPVSKGRGFYFAYGETENTTKYSFKNVDIYVIIYNEDIPIAAGKTDQLTMAAGKGWEFRIFWDDEFEKPATSVDYVAETNIFDQDNFMNQVKTGKKYKSK